MSKTYTAAEVEAMLQAERAKHSKASNVTVIFEKSTKISQASKKPYTGVYVSGPFRPHYLPLSVANAILANSEAFTASVRGEALDKTGEGKVLSSDTQPRIVAAAS